METYITTLNTLVTRQATHSCRLWSLQLTLAEVFNRESLSSLVFDQAPTSHAVLIKLHSSTNTQVLYYVTLWRIPVTNVAAKAINIKN